MVIVDDHMAVRILGGGPPSELEREDAATTVSFFWRVIQRIWMPGRGSISSRLSALSTGDREVIRYPNPEVLEILDPRPLLDSSAEISARFGGLGYLSAEMLAAAVRFHAEVWLGNEHNIGRRVPDAARTLGVAIRVVS